jgi:tyramine---L-glutamate ligase
MRHALYADLRTVPDIAVTLLVSPASPAPPGARIVHAPAGMPLREFIPRAALQFDFAWIVAPEQDGLLEALARDIDATRWLGCTPSAIAVAGSKRATLSALHAAGIRTPLVCDGSSGWVVKPDDGAGGLGVRVHPSRDEAEADWSARRARGELTVLEPWVDGEARSLSLLCGAQEVRLLSVNRQRLVRGDRGEVEFLGVDSAAWSPTPALSALAERVHAAMPGLRGLVGIDYVEHPHVGAVVIEINPRPTSACVGLAARIARSPAGELLAMHTANWER